MLADDCKTACNDTGRTIVVFRIERAQVFGHPLAITVYALDVGGRWGEWMVLSEGRDVWRLGAVDSTGTNEKHALDTGLPREVEHLMCSVNQLRQPRHWIIFGVRVGCAVDEVSETARNWRWEIAQLALYEVQPRKAAVAGEALLELYG